MNLKIFNLIDENGDIFSTGILRDLEVKHGIRKGTLRIYWKRKYKYKGLYSVVPTDEIFTPQKRKKKQYYVRKEKPDDIIEINKMPTKEDYILKSGQKVTLTVAYNGNLLHTFFHPINI